MSSGAGRAAVVAVVILCYCVFADTATKEADAASRVLVKRHLLKAVAANAATAGLGVGVAASYLSAPGRLHANPNEFERYLYSKLPGGSKFLSGGLDVSSGMILAGLASGIYGNAQLHLAVGESALHHLNKGSQDQPKSNARVAQKLALAAVSNGISSVALTKSVPVTGTLLLAGSGYYGLKSLMFDNAKRRKTAKSKARSRRSAKLLQSTGATTVPSLLVAFAITMFVLCF
ncbi:hypothetical protein PBRA_000276 [Plasmodiophora brassicae]|uniref:Uncharacterized protein n=1 Tax=Plasmodiophora brassicae TaxID=37360 RepID=A0A0G4IGZ9_PLABS|nr:hypothetical protein PBRA_000276 [Plasmodiophora brassicae]